MKKIVASMVLSVAIIGSVGTVTYGMTLYGTSNIKTPVKVGIQGWAYTGSPYKSVSVKVTEGKRSSGWKTGRSVTATIGNNPFKTANRYAVFNQ